MKSFLIIIPVIFFFVTSVKINAQTGEEFFKQKCSACHTIGKGKLVGPDLSGITKKRTEEWLLKFITSSQTFINSGDEEAKKIFEENNKVIMPDPGLNETEIKGILAYIDTQEGGSVSQTPVTIRPLVEANQNNIVRGKQLFMGEIRFANGGASCVSCHSVPEVTKFGGGTLAIDLTTAYSKLSEAGMVNIIQNQPFPVMKQAFSNNSLTESEIFDVSSYLKNVDEKQKYSAQLNQPKNFLYSGIGGLVLLLLVFAGFWHYRRKRSVNYKIYKRQEDYLSHNIFKI